MTAPVDLEHERFVRRWSDFIHRWVRRTIQERGGSPADVDDVRQEAFAAAWAGYLEWKALAPEERTDVKARMIIGRSVRDAAITHWCELRDVPRDDRQRGAGRYARLLRASLAAIGANQPGYAAARLEAHCNRMVDYQLLMVGLVHGQAGLVRPDTRMLRHEVKERLGFAIEKLPSELHALVVGKYFEGRTFREVGRELGIDSTKELHRKHREALGILLDEMAAFASALSARHTGQTLDDEPLGPDLY
ncbi:MAG: sigma-70 family RNA polymerase sigma factor [Myxococcales bacterium]|nr:sigma-70 family RNA polymerase sigma factor [Myxococcales bacterium]